MASFSTSAATTSGGRPTSIIAYLGLTAQIAVHDRDELLVHDLDVALDTAGLEIVKTPLRAPDANAHAERWVGSVTRECLDQLILVGLGSLQRTLRIYRDFFNSRRPHQGIGNRIPERQAARELHQTCGPPERELRVEYEQFLGGLLNSYYRRAA